LIKTPKFRANKENINNDAGKKKGKKERKWDLAGTQKDAQLLDYSAVEDVKNGGESNNNNVETSKIYDENVIFLVIFILNIFSVNYVEQIPQNFSAN